VEKCSVNIDLLNVVKQIVAERGETILSEPGMVKALLLDLVRDVPKSQRNALIKCLEYKFVQTLRNVNKAERANCKQRLAEKLHKEEGLDVGLCGDTVELLARVLFGKTNIAKPVPQNNVSLYGTFSDPRDGRVYRTVKIGEQVWMAENLAYNAEGGKCYENKKENSKKYGRLYHWTAAMEICPPGWHLPSNAEWQILIDFVGGKEIAGKKLKAKNGWNENGNGTDDFGFAAMPCGYGGSGGNFDNFGYEGYWWSSSYDGACAYLRYMLYNSDDVGKSYNEDNGLFSVRCIQEASLSNTFTDPRDGKVYRTVKIGGQVWMAENLVYDVLGSKCYENNSANCVKYGRLYDWNTAMKICPPGWHLPSKEEWDVLVDFSGGEDIFGKKLKAKSGWNENGNGTDDFGFSALPSGLSKSDGSFINVGYYGCWWSSSEDKDNACKANYRWLCYEDGVSNWCNEDKSLLLSVRCYQNNYALRDVPENLKTAELCLEAIKKNGYELCYVPESLKTAELCLEAIKKNGDTLCYVPENLKTEELCIEAVKQNSMALNYVPENLKTELCLEAVKKNSYVLGDVPENLKTAELCLEAVKQLGKSLEFVPETLKTVKLCFEAVKNDNYALEYVPDVLKTAKLCLEVVKKRSNALCCVPKNLKTEKFYFKAVKKNGEALQYVPENLKTEKLCLEAVKQNDCALQYVPENLKTAELCLKAVKKNGIALNYVPKILKTAELCLKAVKKNGAALEYVPENLKTEKLCLEAVKQLGKSLEYVPENLKTAELCLESVKQNSVALEFEPSSIESKCTKPLRLWNSVLNQLIIMSMYYNLIMFKWRNKSSRKRKLYIFFIFLAILAISLGIGLAIKYFNQPQIYIQTDSRNVNSGGTCPNTVTNNGTASCGGQTYKTVQIGKQIWMAENLAYATAGSKCYENSESNCQKYGRLYHWYDAMYVCPKGWHLPSKEEWDILVDFVGGKETAGEKLKAKNGWNEKGNGTNKFNFAALPGGYGKSDNYFSNIGNNGYWWSSTEETNANASFRVMGYNYEYVNWYYYSKFILHSVRCMKD